MVLVLLLMLFLALISVALWAYTRTVLTSAAAQAARYAANADIVDPNAAAARRVADILGGGPLGSTRSTLRCTTDAGGLLVTVTCTMDSPGIVPLLGGIMPDITGVGHAAREIP